MQIHLIDGSGSVGLFRKGKTHIIVKFHRTDLLTCSHSREGKTPSSSHINTFSNENDIYSIHIALLNPMTW